VGEEGLRASRDLGARWREYPAMSAPAPAEKEQGWFSRLANSVASSVGEGLN